MSNIKLEKIFLIISLIVGSILLMIVPAFNSPDEASHFFKAYQLSKGDIIPHNENGIVGYRLPDTILKLDEDSINYNSNRETKYTYTSMYYDQLLPYSYDKETFVNVVTAEVPAIAYIAPAIGIQLTDNLTSYADNTAHVSPVVILQFARFLSLIIYSVMCYFAIKITPKFKKSFFAILLIPTAMFLRSMVTYDSFAMAMTALSLANILRLIYDKDAKFRKRDFVFFIIAGFSLLNVKMVYSIVFLGMLAVPDRVFGGRKQKWKDYVIMIGIVLALSILRKIPYMGLPIDENQYVGIQKAFIFSHPIYYIKVLYMNITNQFQNQMYWMIGTLGYLDTYIPKVYEFFIGVYLVIVFLIDAFTEKIKLPLWLKIGYALCVIFVVCGMYTIMYMSWTPAITGVTGGDSITGIQGRYYLPLLFLIPVIFNNPLLDNKIFKKYKNIIEKFTLWFNNNFFYGSILAMVITVVVVYTRYCAN